MVVGDPTLECIVRKYRLMGKKIVNVGDACQREQCQMSCSIRPYSNSGSLSCDVQSGKIAQLMLGEAPYARPLWSCPLASALVLSGIGHGSAGICGVTR